MNIRKKDLESLCYSNYIKRKYLEMEIKNIGLIDNDININNKYIV